MKKIAVLFSGQGSQYIGMGKALYEQHEVVRKLYQEASDILAIDMVRLCFEGPAELLNKTENTQPALLLNSVAAYQVFINNTHLSPQVFAGHSLGELSALVCAGVLSFADGLTLARARGLAMSHSANEGTTGMYAITKLERDHLEKIAAQDRDFGTALVIANFNSPRQQVLSGDLTVLARVGEQMKAEGGTVIPLRVSGAFHSPYMNAAAQEFNNLLEKIELNPLQIPVVANVDGKPYQSAAEIREKLVQQITAPVLWQDTMEYLRNENVEVFIEAGPGEVLRKLAQINIAGCKAFALDKAEEERELLQELDADIRLLKERPTLLGKCLAIAVSTKNNNWDETSYRQGVVEPYQKIKEMYDQSKQSTVDPEPTQLAEALDLLRLIFTTKGTPPEEQRMRYLHLAEVTGKRDLIEKYIA